ncbi:MAG TPA: phytoene/squalene synthase family protein [Polyangiales bacterium]
MLDLTAPAIAQADAEAPEAVLAACRAALERHARTFALAARLLPQKSRDRAAALYAYCRYVDDAIDGAPRCEQNLALAELWGELDAIEAGRPLARPDQQAFQVLLRVCRIPSAYPRELIAGMAMDVEHTGYETLHDLLLYCHRVAGVVGLMMCHVFGVTRDIALVQAAQLGIAMQLTNICRDVAEDLSLGRLYLPKALLRAHSVPLPPRDGQAEEPGAWLAHAGVRRVMTTLLDEADRYYQEAERGIVALPFRAGLAVRAARVLYAAIGDEVRRRGTDPRRGRAFVRGPRKLWLVTCALARQLLQLPRFVWEHARRPARLPSAQLAFPDEILPSAAPPARASERAC